ncbi:MAG: DUF3047 domain-containing protein [Methylococcaceae bacterium]
MLTKPALFANEVHLGDFSTNQNALATWQEQAFKNKTRYELLKLDGIQVVKATSTGTASGLFKKQTIDLRETPYLNWRWRIENRLAALQEQSKSGDDYVARVYVIKDGGLAFWQTLALNYVWASSSARGQAWPNAYAGKNTMMLAIRSASDNIGTWYAEKRNIAEDFKQLTGQEIDTIDAIAIMTDTDNSHLKAQAYYGDIFFSSK